MAGSTAAPSPLRKSLESYTKLGRSPIESGLRTAKADPSQLPRPPIQNFTSSDALVWVANWLETLGSNRCAFKPYPNEGDRGKYDLSTLLAPDESIRVAVAGDWGTGTDVAQQVADSMVATEPKPELTIHLGDIYYVGTENEVKENFLGVDGACRGVFWRHGSKGSFALNGNHEMYSGGNPYFSCLLPTLGIPSSQDKQQLRSYFCLEAPSWRIVAIDTGYNSDTISGDCTLEKPLLDWLRDVVDPINKPKPTVLLSHHQWFSGFGDGDYPKPAQQIAPFFKNQQIVWLWGHEHRLAIFYSYESRGHGLSCYARCIGHGGMPLETPNGLCPNPDVPQRVEYWDDPGLRPERFRELPDKSLLGTNGYALLTIKGTNLSIEYLDADGTSVLKEAFVPGGGLAWDGTLVRTVVNDPQILRRTFYE